MLKFLDLHEDELLDHDITDETNHIPQRACQNNKKDESFCLGRTLKVDGLLALLGLEISFFRCDGGIVLTTSVTRQSPHTASNARHIKIKRRKLRRHELKGPERNKHGLMRKVNKKTPCVKNLTQDRYRIHTKPTLPTGAHSC